MDGTADLNDVLVFARVVEAGGISAARRVLKLPKSTISRRVAALEDRLKVRLLERTSRASRPTEIGRLYYERCRVIVTELEEASALIAGLQGQPRGVIRITAPILLGRTLLGPLVAEFCGRHPEVEVLVDVTNRRVDLVEEGFDVALRAGPLEDTSLVARFLGSVTPHLFASRSFLETHPVRTPSDLAKVPLVLLGRDFEGTLALQSGARTVSVKVRSRVAANDVSVVRAAARHGLGLAALPIALAGSDADGLVRVLPRWTLAPTPVHALCVSRRSISPSIRAFLDLAADRFSHHLGESSSPVGRSRRASLPPRGGGGQPGRRR